MLFRGSSSSRLLPCKELLQKLKGEFSYKDGLEEMDQ